VSDAVDVDELQTWLEDGYASSVRTAYLILVTDQTRDAVQESFLRAWKFRDSLATGSSFQTMALSGRGQHLQLEAPQRDSAP